MKKSYAFGLLIALSGMAACQSDNVLDSAQERTAVATSSIRVTDAGETVASSGVVKDYVSVKPSGARAASVALQEEVLTHLNAARSKSCVCGSTTYAPAPALTLNAKLNTASDKFAVDLATYNYFSHTGRDGSQPWDRMTREGYIWRTAGENIAAGYTTARATVDGWLKSPGHCANIMNPAFKEVGVGYGYSASSTYKHYWVNDFGTQR